MTKNLDAVYENGTFRPTGDADITLPDGARVRLTVDPFRKTWRKTSLTSPRRYTLAFLMRMLPTSKELQWIAQAFFLNSRKLVR